MQIWLAEDEAPQREHLAALLRQVCAARGVACELRAFEDGQALVDAYAPGVDLLLLDIDMPGLSGMDAAHRIRERDERVIIVFCTNLVARALDGYAVAALDFLVKPITEIGWMTCWIKRCAVSARPRRRADAAHAGHDRRCPRARHSLRRNLRAQSPPAHGL